MTNGDFPIKETDKTRAPADRILIGMALMALAMFVIPVRDGIAKHMTDALPVFTIAWGTYCAAAIIAAPIAFCVHGRDAILPAGLASQTARTLLLVGAMTMFFFSIQTVPLANAIAANFVAPFIAAVLAPFVLNERFTWAVAGAVTFGFFGVIVVLQPNGDFDANILWAVGAGFLFAFYMLATRLAAQQAPALATLCYQSVLGAIVLTPFALGAGIQGMGAFLGFFATIGLLQSVSHGLSITAFRLAPASILAPLVYLEIVAAVVVGLVAFEDWPATKTWIGIAIIIIAGCLVALRRN
ncbi:MAG: DMT family transporter [Roseobacter sp.]